VKSIFGGTGMLSRQDLVEVRERRRREAHGWSGGPPPDNFEKLIAGNECSKHFRRSVVTLKEWVIPRKRRGELDSDR